MFRPSVLLTPLILLPSLIVAQETPAGWQCLVCSGEGWELDIAGGPAYLADDAYRFGNISGLDESGGYLFGDFFGRYRDDAAGYFQFDGYLRGFDSMRLAAKGGVQGQYEFRAAYQATPSRRYGDALTPYDGDLNLPANWVRAPNTAGLTELDNSLRTQGIGTDWDTVDLGVTYSAFTRWDLDVDYKRLSRKGNKRGSTAFLFNSVSYAAPVDYTTDSLEVAATFVGESWQSSFRYSGSTFSNANEETRVENPFTSGAGADFSQQAQAPNNQSHQLSLSAAARLPARTVLNGSLSIGRLSQDAALLPFTVNDSLMPSPLPVSTAAAGADTMNLYMRFVSSPWKRFTFEVDGRLYDFDNTTPMNAYDYVLTDSLLSEVARTSTAYDYQRTELNARVDFRMGRRSRLGAGIDADGFSRTAQERRETDTLRVWFTGKFGLSDWGDINVDVAVEDREGSNYELLDNPGAQQNPLMRKYNMADRDRQTARLHGSLWLGERTDIAWEYEAGRDDYAGSAVGLTGSDFRRGGLDVTYVFTNSASVFASLFQEFVTTEQANSQQFSLPDWSATTEDRFTTGTLGINLPTVSERIGLVIDYTISDAVGENGSNTSGLPDVFPTLNSRQQNARLGIEYRMSDTIELGVDYQFESLRTDDWMLDGVLPDTMPAHLAMGINAWNYDANVIYLSVRYTSGAAQ